MAIAEKMMKLDSAGYQKIFGVKKKTFEMVLKILEKEHKHKYPKGRQP